MLGGIYQPDCGLIKVNGKEVKIDGVPAARANGIGIIHQEISIGALPYSCTKSVWEDEIRTKNLDLG